MLFASILFLLLHYESIKAGCLFPRFIFHTPHLSGLWWTDFGLLHTVTRQFLVPEKLRRALSKEPFDVQAAQYGWNQLAYDSVSGQLQLLQVCPETEVATTTEHVSFHPILSSLNRFTQAKCSHVTKTQVVDSVSRNLQSEISLLRVNISCVQRVNQGNETKFLVEVSDHLHRPVYQCLWFKQKHEETARNMFELYQNQKVSYISDTSLCQDNLLTKKDAILWMRFPRPDETMVHPLCPLIGGFQIRKVVDLRNNQPICDFKLYASLQSECLSGEGTEWSFSGPYCNPFGQNYATRLSCHSTWSQNGMQHTFLYRRLNQHVHQVYQMVYESEPERIDPRSNAYPPFFKLWLWHGVRQISSRERLLIGTYQLDAYRSVAFSPFTPILTEVYTVELRRAFGICDDEQESCSQGCGYDAKNQFFCHRTCLTQSQTCKLPLRDSCKFRKRYEGHWNLIMEPGANELVTRTWSSGRSRQHMHQFHIYEGKLILESIKPTTNVTLDCVHEIPEAWHDSYIIRMNHQDNGCHARDLCLEFIQSRNDYPLGTRASRSMLYRMAYSYKRDTPFKDVCNFESTPLMSANVFQTPQPRVLIRQFTNSGKDIGSKCGIYQLRIEGTAHLLHQYQTKLTSSMKIDKQFAAKLRYSGEQRSVFGMTRRLEDGFKLQTRNTSEAFSQSHNMPHSFDPSWFDEPLFVQYHQVKPSCRIEMTDFNTDLGSTGEFDNKLRLYPACSELYAPFLQLTEFTCISSHNLDTVSPAFVRYSMLITYSSVLEKYFCWLIKSTSQNSSQLFVFILFPSPQCLYEWSSFGDIQFEPGQALAIFFMTPERRLCSTCLSSTGGQRSRGITRIAAPKPVNKNTEEKRTPAKIILPWSNKWKRTTQSSSSDKFHRSLTTLFFIILFVHLSIFNVI